MRSFAENSFQKVKMTAFRHAHEARRTLLKPIASRISGKRLGSRSRMRGRRGVRRGGH
jgi:hypothetical protein